MKTSPGATVQPYSRTRSITARVENCIVPTNTGSPSSPCAMSAPSSAA
jgi:hypothetical protein